MSAETLRRAAALMRERAEAATPGPWRAVPIDRTQRSDVRGMPENTSYDYRGDAVATAADSSFGARPAADANHIASWHPAVALAVAGWLDHAAMSADLRRSPYVDDHLSHALAVARAFLGEVTDA